MKEPPWLLNNLNDSILEKQTKVSSDALGTLMMAPERMTSLQDCCDASLRLSSDLAQGFFSHRKVGFQASPQNCLSVPSSLGFARVRGVQSPGRGLLPSRARRN